MNTTKKTITALALVAALLIAGAAPATAALTYDDETTDTASTSDLVGGETVTDLDNASASKTLEVISDNASASSLTAPGDAFKLELTVSDSESDETNRTFYTNTSATWENVSTTSPGHYQANFTHAELFAELERDINENVTVDVTVTFNESESDAESSTITVYAQNGETESVEVISDADLENERGVETFNESRWIRDDIDYVSVESDKQIANNTTISYVFENGTVSDYYSNAYDAGSFSSGDFIYSMTAHADGMPIMVFDSAKGDEIEVGTFSGGFLPDEDTYAVYANNGGEFGESPTLEIVPQGDAADGSSLEVSSAGDKELGFWTTFQHFGLDAARAGGW